MNNYNRNVIYLYISGTKWKWYIYLGLLHTLYFLIGDENWRFPLKKKQRLGFLIVCMYTHSLDLFLINRGVCIYRGTRKFSFRFVYTKSVLSVSFSLSLSVLLYYTLLTLISLLYNLVLFSHVLLNNRSHVSMITTTTKIEFEFCFSCFISFKSIHFFFLRV